MAKLNQFEIEAIKLYISVPLQQQTKFFAHSAGLDWQPSKLSILGYLFLLLQIL